MTPPRHHIRYQLEITATYEDSGDYTRNANLEDFLEWVERQASHFQVGPDGLRLGRSRLDIKVKQVAAVVE